MPCMRSVIIFIFGSVSGTHKQDRYCYIIKQDKPIKSNGARENHRRNGTLALQFDRNLSLTCFLKHKNKLIDTAPAIEQVSMLYKSGDSYLPDRSIMLYCSPVFAEGGRRLTGTGIPAPLSRTIYFQRFKYRISLALQQLCRRFYFYFFKKELDYYVSTSSPKNLN
jgi:hypothetical protein